MTFPCHCPDGACTHDADAEDLLCRFCRMRAHPHEYEAAQ